MSKFIFLKSLRELLTPLKRLLDRKAENVNWNENDPSSSSYIAGRTHYKEKKEVFYLNNVKLTFANQWDNVYAFEAPVLNANVGDTFTITWDSVEYKCKVILFEGTLAIGNTAIITGADTGTGEPFIWGFAPNEFSQIFTLDTAESHTVSCYGTTTVVHKIPSEYLPEISSIGKKGTGNAAEIFNDYENNEASGGYAHAEGRITIADGYASHAEGDRTIASGSTSHAEGYYTLASSDNQHVQGQYNIEDIANKYAHIVGNGFYGNRSNAHTIDWNGLGWFAGGLKVGGTGQDDASAKNIATEEYVDEKIATIPTPDVSGQIAEHDISTTAHSDIRESITAPKDGIALIDQVNGYTYIACMRDGNFVTYCGVKSIEVTTMPNKTEYMVGEYFDSTGMIITATTYDGTTKEITDFICPSAYIAEGDTSIEITYEEAGVVHTATMPVTVSAFDPTIVLVDFEYTANDDGTYTITGWKGTLNGEASTEMIIPNNGLIIV